MLTLAVALAAGFGAVARHVLDQVVQHHSDTGFPYGTLVVNVTGSLLLGAVTGLSLRHGLPDAPTIVLSVGFAGGYTTLSTWAWESLSLTETGQVLHATANILGSFVLGLAAAAVGLGLTSI